MAKADEPPFLLDAAHVLEYAHLDAAQRGKHQSAVVEGVMVDTANVSRLVIARNLADDTIFLMHCNDDWLTIAASRQADVDAARRAAAEGYSDLAWVPFRELSAEEDNEIRSTRAFLKELVDEERRHD